MCTLDEKYGALRHRVGCAAERLPFLDMMSPADLQAYRLELVTILRELDDYLGEDDLATHDSVRTE